MNNAPSVNWTNFASDLQQLLPLLDVLAVIIGLLLVVSGLYRWAMAGRRGDISTGGAIARVLCGTFLISINSFLNAITQTLFGQNAESLLAYVPTNSNAGGDIIKVVVYGVQIVGFYAVVRGLMILASAWDGRGGSGAAITHLLGGILAINIVTFLQAVATSMGGSMQSVVANIFG